jgi:CheY-like chemotaxis protein
LIEQGNTYDLILLDDMMPDMRGTEVMHKLKEMQNFNIPTIALTANAITGMKEKYLKDGFDDFLSKPIEKDELYKVLYKYIYSTKHINGNKFIKTNCKQI